MKRTRDINEMHTTAETAEKRRKKKTISASPKTHARLLRSERSAAVEWPLRLSLLHRSLPFGRFLPLFLGSAGFFVRFLLPFQPSTERTMCFGVGWDSGPAHISSPPRDALLRCLSRRSRRIFFGNHNSPSHSRAAVTPSNSLFDEPMRAALALWSALTFVVAGPSVFGRDRCSNARIACLCIRETIESAERLLHKRERRAAMTQQEEERNARRRQGKKAANV